MKNQKGLSTVHWLLILGIIGVIVISAAYIVNGKPLISQSVEDKANSILPIGPLAPAHDLRGTWESSSPGKGMQVSGKFMAGTKTATVYEDADFGLVIDSMEKDVAIGRIHFTNVCVYSQRIMSKPVGATTTPKKCTADMGYQPATIQASGNTLEFHDFISNGAIGSIKGTYTDDTITGTMTINVPLYGDLKGEFHLSRVK